MSLQLLGDLLIGLVLALAIAAFFWSLDTVRKERAAAELPVLFNVPRTTTRLEVWRAFDRMLQPVAESMNERARAAGKLTLGEELDLAGMRLTASEFLLIQYSTAGLCTLVGLLLFGFSLPMVLLGGLGMFGPRIYLNQRRAARQRAFTEQLGHTLTLLSNALKTGYSLGQAIEVVARKAPSPVAEEFERVVTSIHFGSSIEEALAALVRRINSSDLDFIVVAILLHRKVGGNLAEILDNIGDTIRERLRTKREMSVLTAHARGSSTLISALPLVLGVVMYALTPRYFAPMVTSPIGWVMIIVAAALVVAGNVIMRRLATIA